MGAYEMPAGYGLSVFISRERQRPHARVGIKDLFSSEARGRDNAIGFAQQVIDLVTRDLDVIKVAFVANVCSADQIFTVPGNDEERAAISFSFDVDCRRRSAGEW